MSPPRLFRSPGAHECRRCEDWSLWCKLRLSRTQVRARLALRATHKFQKIARDTGRALGAAQIPADPSLLATNKIHLPSTDDDRCRSCARRPKQAKPRRQDVCVRLEAARGHLTGNFGTQHIHIHTERSESCRAARTPANARPQPPLFCRECSRCSIGALLLDRKTWAINQLHRRAVGMHTRVDSGS